MTPTPTSAQRKQGLAILKPVNFTGRRFTSPGPAVRSEDTLDSPGGLFSAEGPLVRLQVEAYLDDHPEFLESYVARKVKRSTVDRWLHSQDSHQVIVNVDQDQLEPDMEDLQTLSREGSLRKEGYYARQVRAYHSADCTPVTSVSATPARRKSAAVTPGRKYSAANFESGCRSPLLSTAEDGSVSFLTIPPSHFGKSRDVQSPGNSYEPDQAGAGLSNIPPLHDNLTSDMNQASLCFKVAKNLSIFAKAESTTIIQVKRIGAKVYLNINIVNVKPQSLEEEEEEEEEGTNLSLEPALYAYLVDLVCRGSPVTMGQSEVEARFGPLAFLAPSYLSLALIPLLDVDRKVQGLAMICLGENSVKNILDNKLVIDISKLSGICMKNASEYQSMRLELTRSQVFLELARAIFDNQMSIEFTVLKMLANFLVLIECERAQILLSSKDAPTTFVKVYDLEEKDLQKESFDCLMRPYENRFPINSSIIGLVAALGETVNIGDNSSDLNFESEAHRSLLCMPIKDSDNHIVGVVSLINKKTGFFTLNDESFVEAFGIFCGIALANVSTYEQLKAAEARKQVALDIMSYHASANSEESNFLCKMSLAPALSAQLHTFSFTDAELEDIETLTAAVEMFQQLELMSTFKIERETLCRWLMTVKKNYRPEVIYHNWRHAWSVAQVMFSCLVNSGWRDSLGPLTCLGLLVASLCHDLDHRGTNNSYQLVTNSPLAKLYSSSTLERHHLNQALIILNLDGHRILDRLSPCQYSKVLAVIEHSILATDLSLHFTNLSRLTSLVETGDLDWTNTEKVNTLTAALMTAADLGATTKPWEYQQKVAGLVAEEFWYQGDLEKSQLSSPLVPMFDRELRHELPRLQVGFCAGVCLPVYRALGQLSPALEPLEEAVNINKNKWERLAEQSTGQEEETNKVTRNL